MVVKDTRRVCVYVCECERERSSFNKKNVPLIQRPHYEIWMLETVMAPAAPPTLGANVPATVFE